MAKIMVVEDSAHQRDFLAAVLRRDGHEVVTARNGSEALECLAAGAFDLVLTDIFMPDCDGLELIRRVRASDTALPIVAMSAGLAGDLFLHAAETFGANASLDKAEVPGVITSLVDDLLSRGTARSEPSA